MNLRRTNIEQDKDMTQTNDTHTEDEHKLLSIRIGTDGFSFAIVMADDGEHTDMRHHAIDDTLPLTANIKQLFAQEEALRQGGFSRTDIVLESKRFCLLPTEFFERDEACRVFYHNYPKQENECVLHNTLPHTGITVPFGIDKTARDCLLGLCHRVKFYSQASLHIAHMAALKRPAGTRALYACPRRYSMEVYAYGPEGLLLANSFDCNSTADRLYYLLYVWKQLGFDQEKDELHLCGQAAGQEQLSDELQRFVAHVSTDEPLQYNNLKFLSE